MKGYLPQEDQKRPQQPLNYSAMYLPSSSLHTLCLFTVWHKIQKCMEAKLLTLNYPPTMLQNNQPHTQSLSVEEKTSNRLKLLHITTMGNFCKVKTHFHNLSIFHKFIEPCLNAWFHTVHL